MYQVTDYIQSRLLPACIIVKEVRDFKFCPPLCGRDLVGLQDEAYGGAFFARARPSLHDLHSCVLSSFIVFLCPA